MTHANEELVRRGLRAFATGDVATIRTLLSPAARWHVAGRSLVSGTKVGVDAILSHFLRIHELCAGTLNQQIHDVVGGDHHVVVLIDERAERSGVLLEAREILVIHIAQSHITEAWLVALDQYGFDAFFS